MTASVRIGVGLGTACAHAASPSFYNRGAERWRQLFDKSDWYRIAYLRRDSLCRASKLVAVGERLQSSGFAKTDRAVVTRVRESTACHVRASRREGGRHIVPPHTPVNVGVSSMVVMASELELLGQCIATPTVFRNVPKSLERDGLVFPGEVKGVILVSLAGG